LAFPPSLGLVVTGSAKNSNAIWPALPRQAFRVSGWRIAHLPDRYGLRERARLDGPGASQRVPI